MVRACPCPIIVRISKGSKQRSHSHISMQGRWVAEKYRGSKGPDGLSACCLPERPQVPTTNQRFAGWIAMPDNGYDDRDCGVATHGSMKRTPPVCQTSLLMPHASACPSGYENDYGGRSSHATLRSSLSLHADECSQFSDVVLACAPYAMRGGQATGTASPAALLRAQSTSLLGNELLT